MKKVIVDVVLSLSASVAFTFLFFTVLTLAAYRLEFEPYGWGVSLVALAVGLRLPSMTWESITTATPGALAFLAIGVWFYTKGGIFPLPVSEGLTWLGVVAGLGLVLGWFVRSVCIILFRYCRPYQGGVS